MIQNSRPLYMERLSDARRDLFDALRNGVKHKSDATYYNRTMAIIFGVPRSVMGLERGQHPQISENAWYLSLVKYQLPLIKDRLHPSDYDRVSYYLDIAINVAEWALPSPIQPDYRNHPAFALAQQFAALRTDEGRILAKHYFRVAFRGIKA